VPDIHYIENGQARSLQLRVHPEDLQLIREHLADEPSSAKWRLIADETILRCGCTAETILGNIDATLQTRWQRVTSALGLPRAWEDIP
jgi:flagellar assembly protein FliH